MLSSQITNSLYFSILLSSSKMQNQSAKIFKIWLLTSIFMKDMVIEHEIQQIEHI